MKTLKINTKIFSIICSFVLLGAHSSFASTEATYNIKWSYKGLPIEIEMYDGPPSLVARASEAGEFKGRENVPVMNKLKDGKIKVPQGESRAIVLVIKNKSDSPLKFAVAPHGVEPVEASLGIKFNCLCNGHTFNIPPKTSWYRILELKTIKSVETPKKEVTLDHHIFRVK